MLTSIIILTKYSKDYIIMNGVMKEDINYTPTITYWDSSKPEICLNEFV